MPDVMSLNDTQLRQIIAALNGDWWWHWFQVASIFASAFFGYLSGIALEHLKTRKTGKKATRERQEHEVAQVNIALSGICYNIEILLHVVSDYILPHHEESHIAYTALHKVQGDCQKQEQLAMSLPAFPALTTTCPEVHFLEWDFFKELPFIVEKDPELLKNTGWLISQSRELTAAIKNHNGNIVGAMHSTVQQGGLKTAEQYSILHFQKSIADAECLISLQLFDKLLDTEKRLEAINNTYDVKIRKAKAMVPNSLETVIKNLREIAKRSGTGSPCDIAEPSRHVKSGPKS
jgi:hypothetical protein